jgi:hypothetical protein
MGVIDMKSYFGQFKTSSKSFVAARSGRSFRAIYTRVPGLVTRKISSGRQLRPDYPFGAIGFGAGIGYVIALSVEADDEHGSSMTLAVWLVGGKDGCVSALRRGVADALAEAAMAKLVSAAEEFDAIVGVVRSKYGFHGAIVLVAKGQDVRPHAK